MPFAAQSREEPVPYSLPATITSGVFDVAKQKLIPTDSRRVDIGRVVAPIQVGEHAHVHNIKTKRW